MRRDGGPELVIRGEHPWLVSRQQGHPWPLPPRAVGAQAKVWLDRHASLRLADAGASAAAARGRRAGPRTQAVTARRRRWPPAAWTCGRTRNPLRLVSPRPSRFRPAATFPATISPIQSTTPAAIFTPPGSQPTSRRSLPLCSQPCRLTPNPGAGPFLLGSPRTPGGATPWISSTRVFWEAHEVWEGFWNALGSTTPEVLHDAVPNRKARSQTADGSCALNE